MDKMDMESKHEPVPPPATSRTQTAAALAARLGSVVSLILVFVWLYKYRNGLDWHGTQKFNLHPFFMVLGIPFFLTNGVLSWRDVPLNHLATKAVHVTFNVLALTSIAIGLYITFNANSAPHVVTLHSWMALASVLLLALQALGGALFYLLPVFPFSIRARVLPLHAWLGVVSYTMLMLVVCTGIIEWLAYSSKVWRHSGGNRSNYTSGDSVVGNVLGLIVFATLLGALWSLLPRRNVAIDVEERDGAGLYDPSRSRLKAGSTYGTPTSSYTSTGPNPFGADPLPPRRGVPPYVEREAL